MIREFRDFINRGNVVELAVAFVLGAAFAPIVDAIVDRLLMPLVGMLVGEPNFDAVGLFACGAGDGAAEGLIHGCAGSVGAVLTALVNFLLIAFALFFVIKAYNRFKSATSEPEPDPDAPAEPDDVTLLREIRDLLARRV